jgi:ABC-type multidrug transport system ATPase subunit
LCKRFGEQPVLDGFDLEVPEAGITALTGPNGAGKSTLLACLAGAAALDDGVVELLGAVSEPSSADHWRAVYGVLDDFTWLPGLTVTDHLLLLSPERSAAAADDALASLGVPGLGDRRPASLSSGQRQRAALATALVRPWHVLLLDEPERHLDAAGEELVVAALRSQLGPARCVVLATHSAALISALGCDVVAVPELGG